MVGLASRRSRYAHDERHPDDRREVNGDETACVWINGKGKSERDTFAAGALKKYEGRRPVQFVF